MAKILLDIGAHIGETARVALAPQWGFDTIYSFEPASNCWPQLDELASSDPRLRVVRAALWNADGVADLHGAGSIGASMFEEKERLPAESIPTLAAGAWFRQNLQPSDLVFVKINCEGAELEILEDIISSGQAERIDKLVVHFDLRKIPSRAHEEVRLTKLLDSSGVDWISADSIFFGRNVFEKTHNWLAWCHAGPLGRLYYRQIRSAEYCLRVRLYNARMRYSQRLTRP